MGGALSNTVLCYFLQPRKASATCSSATAAASSGPDDWSARSPRQRDSDPSHSDLTAAAPAGNKPPSPTGAALILSKPPSPCAPGNTHSDVTSYSLLSPSRKCICSSICHQNLVVEPNQIRSWRSVFQVQCTRTGSWTAETLHLALQNPAVAPPCSTNPCWF